VDKRQEQPALHEWRDHMIAPIALLMFIAVSVVSAIRRFGFWRSIVATTMVAAR